MIRITSANWRDFTGRIEMKRLFGRTLVRVL